MSLEQNVPYYVIFYMISAYTVLYWLSDFKKKIKFSFGLVNDQIMHPHLFHNVVAYSVDVCRRNYLSLPPNILMILKIVEGLAGFMKLTRSMIGVL